ncbi:hypothetical protein SAMN05216349_13126 [Oribacterium sp. KHPX15]|uniref:glycosyltransferase n=1 Tax=Oribacterium sp. KHPX15 TaxID=1855342 RepID=UPI000897319E|nr:glycosyltransferase [Oribacterium sp. KHPX15]SEA81583.1 hypothetical protein SAMN05216349_13126 [Oribacterium sp. KHPX15]
MIGIVILNYNTWDLTAQCIESIDKSCHINFKIYIVDNASTKEAPESVSGFISSHLKCQLIKNTTNKGYAAGNNIGIRQALQDKCEKILVTNNDVIFKDNAIDLLYYFLKENEEYGIVGPKVFLPDGSIQEINMGCKMTISGKYYYLLRKTPLKFLSRGFMKKYRVLPENTTKPFDVFAVSGCCFMIGNKAMECLFPLDENTFLYEEENIIGHRMEKMNLKTKYYTNSEIIHLGGKSTMLMNDFSFRCFCESEYYYCKTYLHANKFWIFPLVLFRTAEYIHKYGIKNSTFLIKRWL